MSDATTTLAAINDDSIIGTSATPGTKPAVPTKAKPAAKPTTKPTPKPAAPAKKTETKGKPKADAKKPATKGKPAAKKDAAPRAKKDGLRGPQIRILKALSKAKNGLTRSEVSKAAPVDQAACVEYIGSTDDAVRKANDAKHFPSLVSLGLVKHVMDEDRGVVHEITAKGRAEAAKA